ncbi:MAG: hypothetical protein Q4C01_00705 [Clostridia bacterium]|nr:hypothetical protein [Clostridia bacterium]
MAQYLSILGISLGLTLVLELAYAWFCKVRGKDLLLITLVNLITNPVAVLITLLFRNKVAWIELPIEVGVVFLEFALLKGFAKKVERPFWLSLGMNCFSYGAGLIVSIII